MPLMSPARRGLALSLVTALAIPALTMPWQPVRNVSEAENRTLSLAPSLPQTAAEWRALPRAVDAFTADHFAFREPMTRLGGRLFGKVKAQAPPQMALVPTAPVPITAASAQPGSDLPEAVEGKARHMFLAYGLLRSTGQETDPARSADYASFICEASRRIAARGAKLLFSVAPSPAAIYPEFAPDWALPAKSPTEYDMTLNAARACGVTTVDLRPALIRAKPSGRLYRLTDSHWTYRGALVGFNAIVGGLGHPDWRMDSKMAGWFRGSDRTGDLPRMMGRSPVAEEVEATTLGTPPATSHEEALKGLEFHVDHPFSVISERRGPTVLIVGDSYTVHFFVPYFAQHVGRVTWIHEESCQFDWRVLDEVRPDYVLIMPVERFAGCTPIGTRPKHFN